MIPKVSIITVTYNCGDILEGTLKSIFEQSAKIYELIIIDGGSTDLTLSVIEKFEKSIAHWISEPDNGIYDAMNKGIGLAKGDYLLFLNAGDSFNEIDTLEKIPFEKYPSAEIFYGETLILGNEGEQLGLRRKKLPRNLTWKSFRRGMVVCHQSIFVKREIAPFYDLQYKFAADVDWVIKSLKASKQIIFTKTIISNYTEGGFSNQNLKKSWLDRFCILNTHFGIFQCLLSHIFFIFDNVLLKLKIVPLFRTKYL